jgi:pimeloyl-ACP methyl ester carboxylesterase
MSHRHPLVFVPGNGIPRPVYQKMLVGLAHRFIASGMERLGHDPRFPVTESWPRLIDQLRPHFDAAGEPVTLLGHGSGGWLALLAAYRTPELVRSVILLDAHVPTVAQARLLGLAKRLGLARIPARACGFRHEPSALDPDCLALYRRFACDPAGTPQPPAGAAGAGREGRRFDREVGRQIRETYPVAVSSLAAGGPPVDGSGRIVPCGMLVGRQSLATRRCGLQASRRLAGRHLAEIDGSHLFPLERPLVTAKEIVHLHDRMTGFGGAAVPTPRRFPVPVTSGGLVPVILGD